MLDTWWQFCEKCFINLLILCCGILRSVRCLVADLCMDPLIPAVIMMGGRMSQPCCASRGWSIAYFSNLHVAVASCIYHCNR